MQEAIETHNISALEENVYARTAVNTSFVKTFINWCNNQEENRFLWLGVSLFGLIGAMVPLTLMCIFFFADNNFSLWIVVCSVNVPVLALNLAAQPPKVTLPTLFLSLLVDTIIMVSCLAIFIIK
jgi:hypothetical protein